MEKKESPADIEQPQSLPSVASSINELIYKLPPLSECCIYRVPPKVRNRYERAYTPQVVAIGPFHRGERKLQPMEEHKLRYLRAFLQRLPDNRSLEDCEKVITKKEKEIRDSYDETCDLKAHDFVKMVLIDSCFVIEAILSCTRSTYRPRTFYLPRENFLYETDMMLLENQLPFFVLVHLYQLAFPCETEKNFLEYCIKFFFLRTLIQVEKVEELITKVNDYRKASSILHFVDLLRVCHLPSILRQRSDEKFDLVTIPKVTEIHESGIELKKSLKICPLDIIYESGVLEIPRVVVSESAEYLLSNILALEMCHYITNSYVRDYVFFMDMLIDTPKDVDLLIKKGIITTRTGDSDTVARLFNKVGYNFLITNSNYYFCSVSQDLNKYCKHRRHRWKAAFKRDYCSTPWRIASTTVAAILVVLTFIQAICSIIQTIPSIKSF